MSQTKIIDNKRLKKKKLVERLYVDTNLEGHTEKKIEDRVEIV